MCLNVCQAHQLVPGTAVLGKLAEAGKERTAAKQSSPQTKGGSGILLYLTRGEQGVLLLITVPDSFLNLICRVATTAAVSHIVSCHTAPLLVVGLSPHLVLTVWPWLALLGNGNLDGVRVVKSLDFFGLKIDIVPVSVIEANHAVLGYLVLRENYFHLGTSFFQICSFLTEHDISIARARLSVKPSELRQFVRETRWKFLPCLAITRRQFSRGEGRTHLERQVTTWQNSQYQFLAVGG